MKKEYIREKYHIYDEVQIEDGRIGTLVERNYDTFQMLIEKEHNSDDSYFEDNPNEDSYIIEISSREIIDRF